MACKVQKRVSLRRRLHILRVLTNSNNNANRNSINKSTFLQIHKLKLALETLKREYENLIATRRDYISLLNNVNDNKDVKIEKIREGTFMVKVTCEKGGDKLVPILEAFEEMCVNVEEARVSCENGFSMEAIIVAEDENLDVIDVNEALLKAIGKQSGEKGSEELNNSSNL
ncbi:hypothetical protein MtrunA17_Chr8g0379441 [Medicago truncatula]|uniref:Transcription regulators protein n=1 Tax=Medicago truncatula TaxID=3880 RepID=G7LHU1_MEDTR|nr:uncharacterized protein LOC11408308 [Medicago truncatula]AET04135.1 transcription regulators protein [Medicago truncatula]AFK47995.1 unknown [Medicago truncatula]RHN42663.1 hypothetical protein MtrunA17_Chr8g0379441 [Medicago truncatula]